MKLLLELQYFPPIPYFALLANHQQIVLEQQEHYVKRSYRNRCHIAAVNGLLRLSIPLKKGKNQQQNIRAVRIAYNEPWQSQHWTSIRSAYGNAPFFEYYAAFFEPFFQQKFEFLFDFNLAILKQTLAVLQIQTQIEFSTIFEKTPVGRLDGRNSIHPKTIQAPKDIALKTVHYPQVFSEKTGFIPNLSILDLLFCTGPQAALILEQSFET